MSLLDLSKIKQVPMSESQYIKKETKKLQIVLHHTAGNSSGPGVIKISSKYWGYHLGIKPDVFRAMGVPYRSLDPNAIGIEICNWGPLEKVNGKYYNYVDRIVPTDQVCELPVPYKGHKYYHAYTDAQIESVRQLLIYWNIIWNIPITYNENDMWKVSKNALTAVPGLYTHNSYRKDKSDISPQPKMIEMLKSLSNGI